MNESFTPPAWFGAERAAKDRHTCPARVSGRERTEITCAFGTGDVLLRQLSAAGPLYLRAASVPLTSPAHQLPLLPSCTPGCSKREVRDSPDRGTPVIPFTGDRAETGVEGPWQNTGVSEGGHGRKEAGSQSRQPRNPSVRLHLWKVPDRKKRRR